MINPHLPEKQPFMSLFSLSYVYCCLLPRSWSYSVPQTWEQEETVNRICYIVETTAVLCGPLRMALDDSAISHGCVHI